MDSIEIVEKLRTAFKESPYTYDDVQELCGIQSTTFKDWFYKHTSPQIVKFVSCSRLVGYDLHVLKDGKQINVIGNKDDSGVVDAIIDTWHKSGVSLTELERRSGYSRSTLAQWFKGITCPRLTTAIDVANALGLEIVIAECGGSQ